MGDRSILKRIELSGFKSIGSDKNSLDLELSDINIIIGANGSGKTNLLSFFKMLNYMMTGAFQNYIGKYGSAENLLYFGSKCTSLIHSRLTFANNNDTDVYAVTLEKSVQDFLVFSNESIEWRGKTYELAGGQKESYLASHELNYNSEKIIKHILSNCRTFQFHDTSMSSHIRTTTEVENNRYIMSDGGNIAAYLYMLKKTPAYGKYYNRIVERIRFVMPQFHDFFLEPQALNPTYIKLRWLSIDNNEYTFGAEQLSDGSIRFIALTTLFLQPPELLPKVIIVDEPELGLHPQAIDILASMIKTAARHVQVIVATQSSRLLDSFDASKIIVADYDDVNRCSLFRRLDKEQLHAWLDDFSLSELWEKNVLGGQP